VINLSVSSSQGQWYPPLGAAHGLVYRRPSARSRTWFMLGPGRAPDWTLGIVEIVRRIGAKERFKLTYARQRVQAGSVLAGLTYRTATIDRAGTILSLTLIDKQYKEPGTEVSVV
jgi:hypothetical protein